MYTEDERKKTMEEIRGYQADIESSKNDIENLSEQLQNGEIVSHVEFRNRGLRSFATNYNFCFVVICLIL